MLRQYLLLAAAAASTVGASQVPRNDVLSVPQTRVFPDGVRNGALMGVAAPDPTPAPKLPRFAAMNLLEPREEVSANTCGYFNNHGSWDWFTCANNEAVCSTSGTIRQCCLSSECSTTTFGSSCLDFDACDSTRNPETYCCTYTFVNPYCTSFLWSTDGSDIFTFFGCGADSTSRVQILYASTEGVNIGIGTTTGEPTRGSAVPNPDDTSTSAKPSSTSPPKQTTTASPNGNNAPVGAIVGGVIGGIAIIALLALGIFFILKRNRNNNNNNNNNGNGNLNNPAAQPFMATHNQPPAMHNAMGAQGPHSPSAYASIGYAGSSPSPYTHNSSPYTHNSSPYMPGANPHQSMCGAPGVSPQPTGVSTSPSYMGNNGNNWAAGPPPPPQSPPPSWGPQYPQGAPVVGWNTGGSDASKALGGEAAAAPAQDNAMELASMNPVGHYGGNNRAELG